MLSAGGQTPAVKLKIDHCGGWRQYFWVIFVRKPLTFNAKTKQQAIQQGEKSTKLLLFLSRVAYHLFSRRFYVTQVASPPPPSQLRLDESL